MFLRALFVLLVLAGYGYSYQQVIFYQPCKTDSAMRTDLDTNMIGIINDSTAQGYNTIAIKDKYGNYYTVLIDSHNAVLNEVTILGSVHGGGLSSMDTIYGDTLYYLKGYIKVAYIDTAKKNIIFTGNDKFIGLCTLQLVHIDSVKDGVVFKNALKFLGNNKFAGIDTFTAMRVNGAITILSSLSGSGSTGHIENMQYVTTTGADYMTTGQLNTASVNAKNTKLQLYATGKIGMYTPQCSTGTLVVDSLKPLDTLWVKSSASKPLKSVNGFVGNIVGTVTGNVTGVADSAGDADKLDGLEGSAYATLAGNNKHSGVDTVVGIRGTGLDVAFQYDAPNNRDTLTKKYYNAILTVATGTEADSTVLYFDAGSSGRHIILQKYTGTDTLYFRQTPATTNTLWYNGVGYIGWKSAENDLGAYIEIVRSIGAGYLILSKYGGALY